MHTISNNPCVVQSARSQFGAYTVEQGQHTLPILLQKVAQQEVSVPTFRPHPLGIVTMPNVTQNVTYTLYHCSILQCGMQTQQTLLYSVLYELKQLTDAHQGYPDAHQHMT